MLVSGRHVGPIRMGTNMTAPNQTNHSKVREKVSPHILQVCKDPFFLFSDSVLNL